MTIQLTLNIYIILRYFPHCQNFLSLPLFIENITVNTSQWSVDQTIVIIFNLLSKWNMAAKQEVIIIKLNIQDLVAAAV